METDYYFVIIFVLGATLMSSCDQEDTSALEAKLAEQQLLLEDKEDELSQLRKEVAAKKVDDPSEAIVALRLKVEEIKTDVEVAQRDVKSLSERKQEVIKNFSNYRENYPMRTED